MCDEYRMNGDKLRIESNERIAKNTEIDQRWADWLAPTRRSFLFGAGRCNRPYAWRGSRSLRGTRCFRSCFCFRRCFSCAERADQALRFC
jgi:hypothetical protein